MCIVCTCNLFINQKSDYYGYDIAEREIEGDRETEREIDIEREIE